MNREQLQGQWGQLKGKVQEKWGKLTEEDLTECKGKGEQLIAKLVVRYGITKEEAEKKLDAFLGNFDAAGKEVQSVLHNIASVVEDCQTFAKDKPVLALTLVMGVGMLIGLAMAR